MALGGATEHQGYGTPHLHVEIHVACAYQSATLQEVAELLKKDRFSFDQWIAYHEWFHAEDVLDPEVKQTMAKDLEEQWHSRFAGKDRKVLKQPPYLYVFPTLFLGGDRKGGANLELFMLHTFPFS